MRLCNIQLLGSVQDCSCSLTAVRGERSRDDVLVGLTLYDLLLETRGRSCRADWLLLRQNYEKHRHCGAILSATRDISVKTGWFDVVVLSNVI